MSGLQSVKYGLMTLRLRFAHVVVSIVPRVVSRVVMRRRPDALIAPCLRRGVIPLSHLRRPCVVGRPQSIDAVLVIRQKAVTKADGRRAAASTRSPATGVISAVNRSRAVADRIVAVKVGVVVAAAVTVVVAKHLGVVQPAGVRGEHEGRVDSPA